MKQLPEKVFKFKLTATATFSLSSNCGSGCCGGGCSGGGWCNCSYYCACTSFAGEGGTTTESVYFTVTWRNVCLAEVFNLPSLQENIIY